MRNTIIILFAVFAFFEAFSQGELKVEIIDAKNEEPISFATVRFKGTRRGFIADYDGQFRLPFKKIDSIPNLLITALGYKSVDIIPTQLHLTELNIVKMTPQIESLDAVVIAVSKKQKVDYNTLNGTVKKGKKMLASEIVDMAIKQIPFNLDDNAHSYIGYYRDYQLSNNEYYNLNESILEQFDAGIRTHKINDSVNKEALYSFKQNTDFKTSETYASQYDGFNKFVQNAQIKGFGGNELSILNVHNPIRNYDSNTFSYVYQLNKNFIANHKFEKSEIYFVDDIPVIDITFITEQHETKGVVQTINKQKPRIIKNRVNGKLTIALTDFSIYRFNYTMQDFNSINPLFNVRIEYRKQDGKMHLNYISFNNRFAVAEDFTFNTTNIIYNKAEQYFSITVNSDIDVKSVKRRNFKIKFNGRRIMVKKANVKNPRKIELKINDFDSSLSDLKKEDMQELSFLINALKDKTGRDIYRPRTITAYQFREFFVQEVFTDKALDTNLKFSSRLQPLQNAPVNPLLNTEPYIINSPLEKRNMKVKKR